MYCGSCLHDNALAAALIANGCDVALIPLYTPIRTDEENVSIDRVFFGGINVYLQEHFAPFRYLPRFLDRWLDWPWLIDRVSRGGIQVEADRLGSMTVSMLRGESGRQRKEIRRLVDWLAREERPQIVNFSNVLISGAAAAIKRRLNVPIAVTLQGDDLFLNDLKEPYKQQAFAEIARIAQGVDGFIVNTHYYADAMSRLLQIGREKFHIVPLGLNTRDFADNDEVRRPTVPTVGYLARIAPEKGFHLLVEAFAKLKLMPGMELAKLRAAGWLGAADRGFFAQQQERLRQLGVADSFEYLGVVDRQGKHRFLQSLDLLSVPTTYRDPKGLFVLEALAAGTPVVQPNHGAFSELLGSTGGGVLVPPNDVDALAQALFELLTDDKKRHELALAGRKGVLERHAAPQMARATAAVFGQLIASRKHPAGSLK